MRALLLATAALAASPAAAQDHAIHEGHTPPTQQDDHAAHENAMHGHSPPESAGHAMHPAQQQQEVPARDHAQHQGMDHSGMDHSAMDHGTMDHSMDHSAMDHGDHRAMDIPVGPPPPLAFAGPEHAADLYFDRQSMAAARAYNHASHGGMTTGMMLVERLEARLARGHDAFVWDASGWYGTATEKIVFKTEGEGEFGGSIEDAEMQLLWSHAIGPFTDLQAGMRVDVEPQPTAHLAVGAAGLAPYMIHFDAAAFVSDEGDLTARIKAEHDMRFTQSLILQPRVEAELSAQDIPERSLGAGLSRIHLGARLRYEIVREFAPYIGVEYEAATGRTARFIRADGGDPHKVTALLGLRFWF